MDNWHPDMHRKALPPARPPRLDQEDRLRSNVLTLCTAAVVVLVLVVIGLLGLSAYGEGLNSLACLQN
jgi:hypothetical protein